MSIDGALDVGERVTVCSRPEPTHIVVGPGANLTVADDVFIGQGAAISSTDRVSIGANTVVGPFVMIADSDFHVAGDQTAVAIPKPISVGRDVVIGAYSVLLPGSDVGDGVTIAAGSVVSGPIPSGASVAGNPAMPQSALLDTTGPGAVSALIADVFDLDTAPDSSTTSEQVEGWDSLGALRLLVAVEANFSVRLEESVAGSLDTVGGWEQYVAQLVAQ